MRKIFFIILIIFLSACSRTIESQNLDDLNATEEKMNSASDVIPRIEEIRIVYNSESMSIQNGQYQVEEIILQEKQDFEIKTSENTTKVDFIFIPSGSGDIKLAYIYPSEQIQTGLFHVKFNQINPVRGHGYFLVYNKGLAIRSAEFSLYKE